MIHFKGEPKINRVVMLAKKQFASVMAEYAQHIILSRSASVFLPLLHLTRQLPKDHDENDSV